jgi:hypothetical protein
MYRPLSLLLLVSLNAQAVTVQLQTQDLKGIEIGDTFHWEGKPIGKVTKIEGIPSSELHKITGEIENANIKKDVIFKIEENKTINLLNGQAGHLLENNDNIPELPPVHKLWAKKAKESATYSFDFIKGWADSFYNKTPKIYTAWNETLKENEVPDFKIAFIEGITEKSPVVWNGGVIGCVGKIEKSNILLKLKPEYKNHFTIGTQFHTEGNSIKTIHLLQSQNSKKPLLPENSDIPLATGRSTGEWHAKTIKNAYNSREEIKEQAYKFWFQPKP